MTRWEIIQHYKTKLILCCAKRMRTNLKVSQLYLVFTFEVVAQTVVI